jgi:hypothetical protein
MSALAQHASGITWDEAAITQHESEAGVLYGTQRVEEAVTPFLYSGGAVQVEPSTAWKAPTKQ